MNLPSPLLSSTEPITEAEFAQSMTKLGPFEPHPYLAVAVSGGSDSLALALLANQWIKNHAGSLIALTVDHQLRPTSTQEAHQVQQWLSGYGINTIILTWAEEKSGRRLQEKAREARYQKLEEWCRDQGVLHLLLGHHLEDQLETVSMRAEKGSGIEGMAGMSALVEKPYHRLLRPLLLYTKSRLQATLISSHQPWIEDPSNQNPKFKRVELRSKTSNFSSSEIHSFGQKRCAYEEALNRLIPEIVTPLPQGYAFLNYQAWSQLDLESQLGVMQRLLMTYGVNSYPPAGESVHKLILHFQKASSSRTLNGCRISRYREKNLLFMREPGAIRHEIDLSNAANTAPLFWDQRFSVHLSSPLHGQHTLKALGQKGWESVKKALEDQKELLPYPVALTLPSLWQQDQLIAIPSVFKICSNQTFTLFKENAIKFLPCYPLTRFTFTIA
ncbi:MAG: tRNA lysidine(34) synthetase TilS [Caedibacter sp. 38-128]|nr:tRNA lysidine(34) synthetase TilS [Holosporales bacterium]OJX07221.1 MAG: tRNA lysidine(34) synthetase TilS [Caedibacter sp. 38-128]